MPMEEALQRLFELDALSAGPEADARFRGNTCSLRLAY